MPRQAPRRSRRPSKPTRVHLYVGRLVGQGSHLVLLLGARHGGNDADHPELVLCCNKLLSWRHGLRENLTNVRSEVSKVDYVRAQIETMRR